MQLNASTYETIFLSYIDNELSPKERLEVELWIAEHPSYALRMEELKATILVPETIQFGWKANLKKTAAGISKEVLEEDMIEDLETIWTNEYTNLLSQDMQAIPGLSKQFKNSLKKETSSKGGIVKAFGFSQNKFTYTAVAAMLMLFIGYKQFTKTPASNSSASNSLTTNSNKVLVPNVSPIITTEPTGQFETVVNNSNKQQLANNIESSTKTKQAFLILKKINTSELEIDSTNKNKSIANAEPSRNNSVLNNQAIISKLQSSYNNPMIIDALATVSSSVEKDATLITDEKASTSYEVIDTEDPNRTILIANFEIDGAAFRGITRRVSALLKRNKSEKEK